MYYYASQDTYFAQDTPIRDKLFREITKEEYNDGIERLKADAERKLQEEEQNRQDYVSALEAENAALLYQILTGEVYSDA